MPLNWVKVPGLGASSFEGPVPYCRILYESTSEWTRFISCVLLGLDEPVVSQCNRDSGLSKTLTSLKVLFNFSLNDISLHKDASKQNCYLPV